MEINNLNTILNRNIIHENIINILQNFNNINKKGIYIYGNTGVGKTTFVINILNQLNYDIIKYNTSDIRNKNIIENITKNNMADKNILSLFKKQNKKIAIIMDEIDGMNNGDKGGINTLIKIIRPKKTKKQLTEDNTFIPIICINNFHIDKKIKELMKVCNTYELKTPTNKQIEVIILQLIPNINCDILKFIIDFTQGDLRKLNNFFILYKENNTIINNINIFNEFFLFKSHNDETIKITQQLLNYKYDINQHDLIINETDRTTIGLLLHENIINILSKYNKLISILFYIKILNNFCFADYIDRITFQKQIWELNEISSLIKIFYNNKLLHTNFKNYKYYITDIRFTKILTKYSTEYNNYIFIQHLCQQLNLDKKELIIYFLYIKQYFNNEINIFKNFENFEITKLDINRIYRYINNLIYS